MLKSVLLAPHHLCWPMLNHWSWFLPFLPTKFEQDQDLDTVPTQTFPHSFRICSLHYSQTAPCFDQQFINLLFCEYIND